MNTLFLSSCQEDTTEIGRRIGKLLGPKELVYFTGELGAGKTSLIKGIVHELTQVPLEEITSPTFTYLNIYLGATPLYHFDLYRISREEEFAAAGFHEFLEKPGICCIEWPCRIPSLIYLPHLAIHIEYETSTTRTITLVRHHAT